MKVKLCAGCMQMFTGSYSVCPHCGFDPNHYKSPEDVLPLGSTLHNERYLVGCYLARGGFGVTYIARDRTFDRRVAIKECMPQDQAERNNDIPYVTWKISDQQKNSYLTTFVREARKMAKVDEISGIVRVRDCFSENNTAYIVMDYVEGETLAQRLERVGVMDTEECFRILSPVMTALSEAHKRGLIHRDISPDNIMIERRKDASEKIWLLDFGIAKDTGTQLSALNVTNHTRMVGVKMAYSPPEQFDPNGNIGPWTDVYAMSATFLRCMTGKVPPSSITRANNDAVSALLRPVGGSVGAVLQKGLALSSRERYQTMEELRDALSKAVYTWQNRIKKILAQKNAQRKWQPLSSKYYTNFKVKLPGEKVQLWTGIFGLMWMILISLVCLGTLIGLRGNGEMALKVGRVMMICLFSSLIPAFKMLIWSYRYEQSIKWDLEISGNPQKIHLKVTSNDNKITDIINYWQPLWKVRREMINAISIDDGIICVGNNTFSGYSNLHSIELSDSLRSIGKRAFANCPNLQKVEIPDSLQGIGSYAFANCPKLKQVSIPEGAVVAPDAFDKHTLVTRRRVLRSVWNR